MDIAKEFQKFLEKIDSADDINMAIDKETKPYILQIKNLLSRIDLSKVQTNEKNLEEFEEILVKNADLVLDAGKKAVDTLCLLHVFGTNFNLDSTNIQKFLSAFCTAIFQCAKISIVSTEFSQNDVLRTLDQTIIMDEPSLQALVKGINNQVGDNKFGLLEVEKDETLKKYIDTKIYPISAVIKFVTDCVPFFIVLHYTQDNQFKQFFTSEHTDKWKVIAEPLRGLLVAATTQNYEKSKDELLSSIDDAKLMVVTVYKQYFLSFLSQSLRPFLDTDVVTQIKKEQGMSKAVTGQASDSKRSVELIISEELGKIEFKPSFPWDVVALNDKISRIWEKFNILYRKSLERIYYQSQQNQNVNSDCTILEFNRDGNLNYQSRNIDPIYLPIIEPQNYLNIPTARKYNLVLGKNKRFLSLVQEKIEELRGEVKPVAIAVAKWEGYVFDIIVRKKPTTHEQDGFAVVLDRNRVNIDPETYDKLMSENSPNPEQSKNKMAFKGVVNKIKLANIFSKGKARLPAVNNGSKTLLNVFGDQAGIEELTNSIVEMYLPDEIKNDHPKSFAKSLIKRGLKTQEQHEASMPDVNLEKNPSFDPTKALSPEYLISQESDKVMIQDWCFDITKIENPHQKSRMVWAILQDINLVSEYKIDLSILCNFIEKMRYEYSKNNNPFHNYDHGLSVLHATYYLMTRTSNFDKLTNLALLVSAFGHDAAHTGRTNQFEANMQTELALTYNDRSILESHHASTSFKILRQKDSNILGQLNDDDYKKLRKDMIFNILSTDMKEHIELSKSFKELNTRVKEAGEDEFNWNQDDIRVFTGMLLHCADLSGPAKEFKIASMWSYKVNQEFTNQVNDEVKYGLPVTPWFKDLDQKHIMAKQEMSFIGFVIKPLWETYNEFTSGACADQMKNIETNIKEWERIKEEGLKEIEAQKGEEKKE